MILYLQVGFEFNIYELKVKDTATFCPFWDDISGSTTNYNINK
jgi:hypothetical protein